MANVAGFRVTVAGLRMTMPASCCRCGAPAAQQLKTTTAVRGFGTSKTRSIDVPYCAGCATRAKAIQRARLWLYLSAIAVAIVASGLGILVPFLPRTAIIVIPLLLSVMAAVVLRQRASDTVERPFGAWLAKGTAQDSTFFCTHAEWAQQFAAANQVPAVAATHDDRVRPWIAALLVAGTTATFVSFGARPKVYVDNGSGHPLQIWIDGGKSIVVQPVAARDASRPTIEVPIGTHVFGWSSLNAASPAGQTQPRKVEWLGNHLYNPDSTNCYLLEVNVYGSASSKDMAQGPLPLDEFYTLKHVDNWFKDNPTSVTSKSSGETRTAINTMAHCAELTAKGCDVGVRQTFTACAKDAFASGNRSALDECVTDAAKACAGSLFARPGRPNK